VEYGRSLLPITRDLVARRLAQSAPAQAAE
jgi:hypothetical protein